MPNIDALRGRDFALAARDACLGGPPRMFDAVVGALRAIGMPAEQIQEAAFGIASESAA